MDTRNVNNKRDIYKNIDKVKALQEASLLDAKDIFPVLVEILGEIEISLAHASSPTEEIKTTQHFLKITLALLKENIERLKLVANPLRLLGVLRSIERQKVLDELQMVVDASKKVVISSETFLLWQETSFWLHAIHKHTDDKVKAQKLKPNPDGTIGPIDFEDKVFYKAFTLTKFSIVSYYLEAGLNLDNLMSTFIGKPKEKPVIKVDDSDEIQTFIIEFLQKRNKYSALLEAVPQYVHDISNILQCTPAEKKHSKEDLDIQRLSSLKDENEQVKFTSLIMLLDESNLNIDQKKQLAQFKPVIIAKLDAYLNSTVSTHGIPTLFMSRRHSPEVKKTKEAIERSDDMVNNLKSIFMLWNLATAQNSIDVKQKLEDILDASFHLLLSYPCKQTNTA